ncbi:TolC family protein [Zoogloea sp.]|uniref:TolC family protein n=1 Tax=Zoogloea sp. TaxID=49181 RepID=UPI0026390C6A|nr:TolC family protein [Zoogloea sp.]MDD3354330.1 TolC family protein [Zoogloea sp.]
MMRTLLAGLALSLYTFSSQASTVLDAPDLPPWQQVQAVLRSAPLVEAAEAVIQVEEARARRLNIGPHEWTLRLSDQQRRVRPSPEGRFNEWEVGLERSLRLPGKGDLDRQLGSAGIASARIYRGDTLHEGCRNLLTGWFELLREQTVAEQWRRQREILARQAQVVARRAELGDAPRLERLQADAALSQAEGQLAQAEGRAQVARERLTRQYPGLSLPDRAPSSEPQPISGESAPWVEAVLAHSHELALARAESARTRVVASRADAERRPDPSVGLSLGRERSGEERIVGLSLSIPLPGEGRRADADAALASASAMTFREAATLRRLESEAAALHRRALANYSGWLSQQAAAEALARSADLSERAWQLGEGSLQETLTARRLAHEARLAAQIARLDASEVRYRLLLDAHRLWPMDEEGEAAGH